MEQIRCQVAQTQNYAVNVNNRVDDIEQRITPISFEPVVFTAQDVLSATANGVLTIDSNMNVSGTTVLQDVQVSNLSIVGQTGSFGYTGPTGAAGDGSTGPTGASETGPTGNASTGPTGASQTGPTGEASTGPTGASQTGPTGDASTGPTGASQTGPTGPSGGGSSNSAIFYFMGGVTFPMYSGNTYYVSPNMTTGFTTAVSPSRFLSVPFAGTITDFYCRYNSGNNSNVALMMSSLTATIVKCNYANAISTASNTSLQTIINNPSTTQFASVSGSVSVSAGDLISVAIGSTGNPDYMSVYTVIKISPT